MTARHRLPEASPGEREEHAHQYLVEVVARGGGTNELGYLVDISELKGSLASVLERYSDRCLNDLEDFRSVVPSLEALSMAIWQHVSSDLARSLVNSLAVRVWEDDDAWAGFVGEMDG
jgi:6-pyruvoyltetrahydropterin/6-carboxytetrahydropterin synthase